MRLQRAIHHGARTLVTALAVAVLAAGCAASGGGGPSDAPLERDYPQAPMRISVSGDGDFVLTVCATESASEERGPWIQSMELLDLQVDPPLTVWEASLPASERKDVWNWNPGTPWRTVIGQAPKGYEDTTPLETELQRDRLYQITITGWDPGELLFVVSPVTGQVAYYDAAARKIPRPRMPCLNDQDEDAGLIPDPAEAPAESDGSEELNYFEE